MKTIKDEIRNTVEDRFRDDLWLCVRRALIKLEDKHLFWLQNIMIEIDAWGENWKEF